MMVAPPAFDRGMERRQVVLAQRVLGNLGACCSRGRPRPRHSRRSAWRRRRCCRAHRGARPGSRARTLPPSPNPGTDLLRRLPPCDPSAHRARCRPSARRSSGCRWLRLRAQRRAMPVSTSDGSQLEASPSGIGKFGAEAVDDIEPEHHRDMQARFLDRDVLVGVGLARGGNIEQRADLAAREHVVVIRAASTGAGGLDRPRTAPAGRLSPRVSSGSAGPRLWRSMRGS